MFLITIGVSGEIVKENKTTDIDRTTTNIQLVYTPSPIYIMRLEPQQIVGYVTTDQFPLDYRYYISIILNVWNSSNSRQKSDIKVYLL